MYVLSFTGRNLSEYSFLETMSSSVECLGYREQMVRHLQIFNFFVKAYVVLYRAALLLVVHNDINHDAVTPSE